jgi:hypothetical protein
LWIVDVADLDEEGVAARAVEVMAAMGVRSCDEEGGLGE